MKDDIFAQDPAYDMKPTEELLVLVERAGLLPRTRALAALARRTPDDERLIDVVIRSITDSTNMGARIFGTISVSHVGFACLWEYGPAVAKLELRSLLAKWPEPDRSDLLWFLKSQDIAIDNH